MIQYIFGADAAAIRKKCGLTQLQLGTLWGKSRVQIGRYESSRVRVPEQVAWAYRGLEQDRFPKTITAKDQAVAVIEAVNVLNCVGANQLKNYFFAKGWKKAREARDFLGLDKYQKLKALTGTSAGNRNESLLMMMAAIPFRQDVLIGKEVDANIAIVEAYPGGVNPVKESAAIKLCRHHIEVFNPSMVYYYASIARSNGFDFGTDWNRRIDAMFTLIDDKTREELDERLQKS